MSDEKSLSTTLVSAASLIVIIAAMKLSRDILTPFLLATFAAIILSSPLKWLEKKGMPRVIALGTVVVFLIVIIALVAIILGDSFSEFESHIPQYRKQLEQNWAEVRSYFHLSPAATNTPFNPSQALGYVTKLASDISSVLSHSLLITFIVIFMLLEAADLNRKVELTRTVTPELIGKITGGIRDYLGLKTIFCIITGVSVWLLALVMKIPFPELWGLLACLLNYIPNIGAILSAIPAIAITFVHYGAKEAVIFAIGIAIINTIVGSILEPRFLGKGLGISILVVFLSLIFWGWVLGPVGMLLSVPLTIVIKIFLESKPESEHIAKIIALRDEA